jgi:hypothetical protein
VSPTCNCPAIHLRQPDLRPAPSSARIRAKSIILLNGTAGPDSSRCASVPINASARREL